MGHGYKAVQWTPFKKRFDVVLALGVAAFLAAYTAAVLALPHAANFAPIQLAIRAVGAVGFALLTLILAIGPLARLSPRFLPLLYNRRHLGVTCFLLALTHAVLVLLWYHSFAMVNPFLSLLTSNTNYDAILGFPFESLGLLALAILFVMAATSHDFWNALLGPGLWKSLHMSVYAGYVLVVAHAVLGAAAADKGMAYLALVGGPAVLVAGLHAAAGAREAAIDRARAALGAEGWLEVGPLLSIPDKRARILAPPLGERIAVFRDGGQVFGLSNRCRHQGGPLGEGRIVDGCVTCPWHGFQYRPQDGLSPPPYGERVATYPTRVLHGVVFVRPQPHPLAEPAA
jgi:nitrite reductase/ring-hydroxylating ferredoxin subunit/DMSO/TMAO reductase YedYZ heme-binding membrane subunit